MSELYTHLSEKNSQGLPYSEAVQLFLWIFCTMDVLPDSLKGLVLDRQTLVSVFSRLEKDNVIIGVPLEHHTRTSHAERWNGLIDDFMRGDIALDRDFSERSGGYV